jgi:uncharacterized membrane protein YkvA (DUF1232 family)
VGLLSWIWTDLKLAFAMTRDLVRGAYPHFPTRAAVALLLALAYIVSPVDLITDLVPVVGWLDDGVVALICLRLAETDLKAYQRWRSSEG